MIHSTSLAPMPCPPRPPCPALLAHTADTSWHVHATAQARAAEVVFDMLDDDGNGTLSKIEIMDFCNQHVGAPRHGPRTTGRTQRATATHHTPTAPPRHTRAPLRGGVPARALLVLCARYTLTAC